MGLRSRIKGRVKRLLGQDDRPAPGAAAPPAVSPPPAPAASPPAPPAPPVGQTEEEAEQARKLARIMLRARKGTLQFVDEQGGVASLADMHENSERRYFVAHKRFSDLMEGLVAEALIDYDASVGEATLTEAGRSWLAERA